MKLLKTLLDMVEHYRYYRRRGYCHSAAWHLTRNRI